MLDNPTWINDGYHMKDRMTHRSNLICVGKFEAFSQTLHLHLSMFEPVLSLARSPLTPLPYV